MKEHWKGTSATLAFKRHNGESTLLKAFHSTQPLSVRLCPLILAYDSFSFSLSRTVFVSLPHVLWCIAAKREPYPTITLKKVHYIIDFWTLHISQKLWTKF